jgi:hypothetical protein
MPPPLVAAAQSTATRTPRFPAPVPIPCHAMSPEARLDTARTLCQVDPRLRDGEGKFLTLLLSRVVETAFLTCGHAGEPRLR